MMKRAAGACFASFCFVMAACGGSERAGGPPTGRPGASPVTATVSSKPPLTGSSRCVPPPTTGAGAPIETAPSLPEGTLWLKSYPVSQGRIGLVMVPESLGDFQRRSLQVWMKEGWSLGEAESEAKEAEGELSREGVKVSYIAQEAYCDPSKILVQFLLSR